MNIFLAAYVLAIYIRYKIYILHLLFFCALVTELSLKY